MPNEKNVSKYAKQATSVGDEPYRSDRGNRGGRRANRPTHTTNDPKWYSANAQLVKDAASLPMAFAIGTPLNLNFRTTGGVAVNPAEYDSVPGILAMYSAFALPTSTGGSDPINVAANKLYAEVRYKNSGSKNYEAPDYMMYLLAMAQAYTLHSFASRVYGIASTYSAVNRYYPASMIAAMGFSFDEIVDNLANLRYRINNYAAKLSQLAVPSGFHYMDKARWAYGSIYMDGTSPKSQSYMFNPLGFYTFTGTKYETGSALEWNAWWRPGQATKRLADLYSLMDKTVARLVENEDIGIMSGDTMKAFSNLIYLPMIDESYAVQPVYDTMVLSQIHNLTTTGNHISGYFADGEFGQFERDDIYQAGGIIKYQPKFYQRSYTWFSDRMLNYSSSNPSPSPEEILESMQLCVGQGAITNKASAGGFQYTTKSMGVHRVEHFSIINYSLADEKWTLTFQTATIIGGTAPSVDFLTHDCVFIDETIDRMDALALASGNAVVSSFDWHPKMFRSISSEAPASLTTENFAGILGDIGTYTIQNEDVLTKLHEVSTLSLFDIR